MTARPFGAFVVLTWYLKSGGRLEHGLRALSHASRQPALPSRGGSSLCAEQPLLQDDVMSGRFQPIPGASAPVMDLLTKMNLGKDLHIYTYIHIYTVIV